MKITRLILFLLLSALLLLAIGCGDKNQQVDNSQLAIGTLDYEVIDTSDALKPNQLAKWYEENYQEEGVHSLALDGSTYLLVCAGEKPTEGYEIDQITLTGTEEEIEVRGTIQTPANNDMVAEVLTYPNILLKIPKDSRNIKLVELKENAPSINQDQNGNQVQRDTGTYVGQIDNNSIEIKISGVPEANAARAFQMADQVKDNFEQFGLETGNQVAFSYYQNEYDQLVLTRIEKINN